MFNFFFKKKNFLILKINFFPIPFYIINFNFYLLFDKLLKYLDKYSFFCKKFFYKKYINSNKIFILFYGIKNYYILIKEEIKNILFIKKNFYKTKILLIKNGFFNIPIFNITFLKLSFNKKKFLIIYLNNFIFFFIKYFFKKIFFIFNLKKNFFFFKNYLLINFFKKLYFYNKNILLNKFNFFNFNFNKKFFIINKIIYFSNINFVFINKIFLQNIKNFSNYLIFKENTSFKFLNIFFKNLFFEDLKNYLFIFDIYWKILNFYFILKNNSLSKKTYFNFNHLIVNKFYLLKKKIKSSFLKNIFFFNKLLFYYDLGCIIMILNRVISIYKKSFFLKFSYKNIFFFKFYLLLFKNNIFIKNFYVLRDLNLIIFNNENFLIKNSFNNNIYYIIFCFYSLFNIWCLNNFILNEKDLFSIKNSILNILSFIIKKKININIFWIINIVYKELFKLNIFLLDPKLIYFYILNKFLFLFKRYDKFLINSIISFRPLNFENLFFYINILKDLIKKKLFLQIVKINHRIYNFLKNIKKNKIILKKNFFSLEEKKLFNIFNKIKYNIIYFFFLKKIKIIIYNEFYLINFIKNFINNNKINSKSIEIFFLRKLLLYENYKILNLFIDLNNCRFSS